MTEKPEALGATPLPMGLHSNSTAAIFGDVGNIYHFIQNSRPHIDCELQTEQLLLAIQRQLLRAGARITLGKIYGIPERAARLNQAVFLAGLQPIYIYRKKKKNTIDVTLAIELTEHLVSAAAADCYVLLGGDSDYIPIVVNILEKGKMPLLYAFSETVSSEMSTFLRQSGAALVTLDDFIQQDAPDTFMSPRQLDFSSDHQRCLEILLQEGMGRESVWLTPLLRKLEERGLDHLSQEQRKNLIRDFQAWGIVRAKKEAGDKHRQFTVLVIDYDRLRQLSGAMAGASKQTE